MVAPIGFGDRLKLAREKAGLTTRELSALLDKSPAWAWQLEDGRISTRPDTVVALAEVLEVRVEWLLAGTGRRHI